MKLLEQIKEEFDIHEFKTLTQTKWCEIKRLIKSDKFDGFYYYYFRGYDVVPWIDPETFDAGYIWNSGGDIKQKLIADFKNRAYYLKIPKMKTYVHKGPDYIVLIPAFKHIKPNEIWEVIRINLKN